MRRLLLAAGASFLLVNSALAETNEVRIPKGAGGIGFLPLLVMEHQGLIEKAAREMGLGEVKAQWISFGGPSIVNDMLLSGNADFAPAGPPAFITIWDKTAASLKVKGVAAMTSIPMYLNTRAPHLKSIRDLTENDKIAVTAVKVSIPAIILQMAAIKEYGPADYAHFDPYTVSLTHPDGVIALTSGRTEITAHFTSPPFHQRERKMPDIRTIMTTNDVMGGPSTFTMLYATSRFHDANPKTCAAVIKALEAALAFINSNKRGAAEIFLSSSDGKGWKLEEILELLNDSDIRFTTSPENVMKYANFMADVGSIKTRPKSWQDMFFPEIHGIPGS
jgi:NitT/TauT family transport system substrate-binding protein